MALAIMNESYYITEFKWVVSCLLNQKKRANMNIEFIFAMFTSLRRFVTF